MRKIWMAVSVMMATAIVLAACGGSAAPAPTATPAGPKVSAEAQKYVALKGVAANGEKHYNSVCIACHGADAKGVTGLGKDLTTSSFLAELSDADVALFLAKGRPSSDPLNTTKVDMPPKGGNPALKDQDLMDIVAFLRTIHK